MILKLHSLTTEETIKRKDTRKCASHLVAVLLFTQKQCSGYSAPNNTVCILQFKNTYIYVYLFIYIYIYITMTIIFTMQSGDSADCTRSKPPKAETGTL